LVFSAASRASIAHIFSKESFKKICWATVTQSFVTVGVFHSSKITFVPLGQSVEHTASAAIFTPFKILLRAVSQKFISLNIFLILNYSIIQIISSSSTKKYSCHL